MKNRSPGKLILGHVNINSLRNKFDSLKNTVGRNIIITLNSEIKLDYLFSLAQFKINGFSAPLRFKGDSKRGGPLMYTREDIQSRQLFCKSKNYTETK